MATDTLSSYLDSTRRLLNDRAGQFFSTQDLTGYINRARTKVVGDTGCLRSLQSFSLVAGQESYNYSDLPSGIYTLDIWGINVIWGNTRYPLEHKSFTELSARFRSMVSYQQKPCIFARYGETKFYVAPVPDQVYVCEIDTVIMPADMTSGTDIDTIPFPFTMAIPYYAAHSAKLFEQSWTEAEMFKKLYFRQLAEVRASKSIRMIANAASIGV